MPLPSHKRGGLTAPTFFAVSVLFAIVYHNLTPFLGVDCWWHMRFAACFLEHGTPVLYDPFAVQGEKILATYPDLFPGILMIGAYKAGSILGLNLLRISVFTCFAATLLLLVRKAWGGYLVLLQMTLLAISMAGREILQPDLFNYLLFALWIWLLDGIVFEVGHTTLCMAGLLLLEQVWINTHPLFFYYGLTTAVVYLAWAMAGKWRNWNGEAESSPSISTLGICLAVISLSWLINPLGWRALESLFINMIDPEFNTLSMRSPLAWWTYINMYGYVAVVILFLIDRPWRWGLPKLGGCVLITMAVLLIVPSFQYERSLPFLCIYVILFQGRHARAPLDQSSYLRSGCMVLTVLASFFLIVYRDFPKTVVDASAHLGLKLLGSGHAGLGVDDISAQEPLREVNLLNRVAPPGNCVTNYLEISSCAVWFCPDKPFYTYGHAAVINRRWREERAFLAHIGSPESETFAVKNNIRTLVLRNSTDSILSAAVTLSEHWQIVYTDPLLTILVRREAMTGDEYRRLQDFYSSFRPGYLDALRFNQNDRIYHYFLLWFSAEVTGNDGSYYLSVAERYIDPAKLNPTREKLLDAIRVMRHDKEPGGVSLESAPHRDDGG